MKDRYQMVIEAVDRIMEAGEPEPEEDRQEEEPIPPRRNRHPRSCSRGLGGHDVLEI
jgi:hypothetical protein